MLLLIIFVVVFGLVFAGMIRSAAIQDEDFHKAMKRERERLGWPGQGEGGAR